MHLKEQFPGSPTKEQQQTDGEAKSAGSALPDELTCRVCRGLLRNAVLATCCGDTFCDECVQQLLLVGTGTRRCPGSDCVNQLGTDSVAFHMFNTKFYVSSLLDSAKQANERGSSTLHQHNQSIP